MAQNSEEAFAEAVERLVEEAMAEHLSLLYYENMGSPYAEIQGKADVLKQVRAEVEEMIKGYA